MGTCKEIAKGILKLESENRELYEGIDYHESHTSKKTKKLGENKKLIKSLTKRLVKEMSNS